MWPVKPLRVLVIGAQRVDTALCVKGRIVADSRASYVLDAEAGLGGILAAVAAVWPVAGEDGAIGGEALLVAISDRWLRWLALPWNDGFLTPDALDRQCRMQFAAAWGVEALECRYAVDDAPYGQPRLAAALEQPLLAGLEVMARERHSRVVAVRSLSIAACQWARRRGGRTDGVVELHEAGNASLILLRHGRPVSVFSQGADLDDRLASSALLRRLALRDPAWSGGEVVATLDLRDPSPEQVAEGSVDVLALAAVGHPSALNFIAQGAALTGRRLGLLAAAILLVLAVGLQLGALQRRVSQAEQTLAARQMAPARMPSALESKGEEGRLRAANTAIRKLNVPITKLLRAVQPPADLRIALLGIDLSDAAQEQPVLRISGEAQSAAEMAAYVGYLGDTRPLRSAYLLHHEVVGEGKGKPYRFTAEAAWSD